LPMTASGRRRQRRPDLQTLPVTNRAKRRVARSPSWSPGMSASTRSGAPSAASSGSFCRPGKRSTPVVRGQAVFAPCGRVRWSDRRSPPRIVDGERTFVAVVKVRDRNVRRWSTSPGAPAPAWRPARDDDVGVVHRVAWRSGSCRCVGPSLSRCRRRSFRGRAERALRRPRKAEETSAGAIIPARVRGSPHNSPRRTPRSCFGFAQGRVEKSNRKASGWIARRCVIWGRSPRRAGRARMATAPGANDSPKLLRLIRWRGYRRRRLATVSSGAGHWQLRPWSPDSREEPPPRTLQRSGRSGFTHGGAGSRADALRAQ
jgi:hypothetical protein